MWHMMLGMIEMMNINRSKDMIHDLYLTSWLDEWVFKLIRL